MPVELALKINCIGNEQDVKDRLRVYQDAGVNTLRAGIEGDTVRERLENLERLMALIEEISTE